MLRIFAKICFSLLLAAVFAVTASAQIDASGRNANQKEELPKNIQETFAKQRIEREKKDYQELLDRSQEVVKLSDELEKSFSDSNQVSVEDRKKLERLEKLVKKIRDELGADDDGDEDQKEKPADLVTGFKTLQTNTTKLFDEVKKSTRYTVSVTAIQTSNAVLKLVKFLRFGN